MIIDPPPAQADEKEKASSKGKKLNEYRYHSNPRLTDRRIFCNTVFMQERVTISSRGVVTIPTRMREAFGLKANDQLIIEDTPQGLLLRPAVSLPIELYSEDRIAEFTRDDQAVAKLLDRPASRDAEGQ